MNATPELFDRNAVRRHRARARQDALFLHLAAQEEVQDRLSMVNKSLTKPAIITPFPEIWRPVFPDALIVDDSDVLALEPGSFDLVIHAMALHWANDPVGQLIQSRRALQPDGLFLGVLLGGGTLNELRSSLGQAETEVTGGLSPRIAPMSEIRDLGDAVADQYVLGFDVSVRPRGLVTVRQTFQEVSHGAGDGVLWKAPHAAFSGLFN